MTSDGVGQIVLVRHGETEWSASGRHTGVTDLPLTRAGEDRALGLAAVLGREHFDAVLCSPRQRARQTAALAGFPDAQPIPELAEWDYGAYEGLTSPQIHAERPGWLLWRDGTPAGQTPGESPEQVRERARKVLRTVAERTPAGGRALLFAHGHFLRAVAVTWTGQPIADGARLALSPATISVLGHEHELPVIQQWNAPAG